MTNSPRIFAFAFSCLLIAAIALIAGCGAPEPLRKPDLLLISIDTLRADHLSCYGYHRLTSPVIDRLAREGVLFEDALSQSPKTATSHMTIMTGLFPSGHRVANLEYRRSRALADEIPTLAQILASDGYQAEAYTAGGNVGGTIGFSRGFSIYEDISGADNIFDAAIDAASRMSSQRSAGDERPFFLFVHTYEVHDPYLLKPGMVEQFVDPGYGGKVVSTDRQMEELAANGEYFSRHKAYWDRVDKTNAEDQQQLRDLYDAGISFTDLHLGRLLESLRELDLLDSTLVVLLSDHGEQFFEHQGYLHNALYREILHVPLVFHFPTHSNLPEGMRITQTARLVDVFPTILDVLRISTPSHVQGRSLLPMIHGEEISSRPSFGHWIRQGKFQTLQKGNRKYIRHHKEEMLFDLDTDLAESNDLSEIEPEMLRRFREEADRFRNASANLEIETSATQNIEIDEKTTERLEALGYLGGDG